MGSFFSRIFLNIISFFLRIAFLPFNDCSLIIFFNIYLIYFWENIIERLYLLGRKSVENVIVSSVCVYDFLNGVSAFENVTAKVFGDFPGFRRTEEHGLPELVLARVCSRQRRLYFSEPLPRKPFEICRVLKWNRFFVFSHFPACNEASALTGYKTVADSRCLEHNL